jgi:hypothetical protein
VRRNIIFGHLECGGGLGVDGADFCHYVNKCLYSRSQEIRALVLLHQTHHIVGGFGCLII